jgi:uncharacterized protein
VVSAYLDASVIVPLFVDEPSSRDVMDWLATQDGPILVSEFAAAEVSSNLSRSVRMGRLVEDAARAALADFDTWRFANTEPVDLTEGDLRSATLLVRRFETKLRAADAVHLAVSRRLEAMLVTRDHGLLAAAHMVGVPTRAI